MFVNTDSNTVHSTVHEYQRIINDLADSQCLMIFLLVLISLFAYERYMFP